MKENKNLLSKFVSGKGQLTTPPAPQSVTHAVPVSAGQPQDRSEISDVYMVVDVTYNAGVLQVEKSTRCKKITVGIAKWK